MKKKKSSCLLSFLSFRLFEFIDTNYVGIKLLWFVFVNIPVLKGEMEVRKMRKEDEEQRVMENIAKAIPLMSDFEKGYVLGMVEARRREKEQGRKESRYQMA